MGVWWRGSVERRDMSFPTCSKGPFVFAEGVVLWPGPVTPAGPALVVDVDVD